MEQSGRYLRGEAGMPESRPAATFNSYVLKAVSLIASERAGQGYDLHSYFTRDLSYGPDNPGAIKANHPPLTMCVAAVTEVMIEALNIYCNETHDKTPFQKLSVTSWKRGSMKDIRAHIFQYDGTKCNGTAHALQRFGIGKQMSFASLLPGDFLTMNRTTGSGHTAVFLGFIGADYGDIAQYSGAVRGFKYFSSQGKKVGGGFGYRWGFFSTFCPDEAACKRRDCNIILSDNQHLLNTGCMLHPSSWNVHPPDDVIGFDPQAGVGEPAVSDIELRPSDLSKYDGVTTDD
jgi:hypothetical protein